MKSNELLTLDQVVKKIEYRLSGRDSVLPGEVPMQDFSYADNNDWSLFRTFGERRYGQFNLNDFSEEERTLAVKLLKRDLQNAKEALQNLQLLGRDALGNKVKDDDYLELLHQYSNFVLRGQKLLEKVESFMPFVERISQFGSKVKNGFKRVIGAIKNQPVETLSLQPTEPAGYLTSQEAFILHCVLKKYYVNEAKCIQDKLEVMYPDEEFDIFDIDLGEYANSMAFREDTDDLKVSHEKLVELVKEEIKRNGTSSRPTYIPPRTRK